MIQKNYCYRCRKRFAILFTEKRCFACRWRICPSCSACGCQFKKQNAQSRQREQKQKVIRYPNHAQKEPYVRKYKLQKRKQEAFLKRCGRSLGYALLKLAGLLSRAGSALIASSRPPHTEQKSVNDNVLKKSYH